jgi:conjugal transfer/entry exclusion protein
LDQTGYDQPMAAAPQKSAEEIESVKKQISDIDSAIKVLQNEIDNNFNLSNIKIRDKKREVNQL